MHILHTQHVSILTVTAMYPAWCQQNYRTYIFPSRAPIFMDENTKFAVAHWFLCVFHFGVLIFSGYCSVLQEMNSYNRVQSYLVFISILPVFVSDAVVASYFTSSAANSTYLYELSINLDIISVLLYQCIFVTSLWDAPRKFSEG